MYAQIFSIVAPILFISLLGYGWSRVKLPYDGKFVSRIVMDVGTPCLILSTMQRAEIPNDSITLLCTITLAGLAILVTLSSLVIRLTGNPIRTFLAPLTFGNTGNMGLPIALFAFGQEGLTMALVVFMVTSMIHFSLGVSLAGGGHPLKTVATSPVFHAAILSLVLTYTDTTLPTSVLNTLKLLGDIAIPLMIFSLGISLHGLHARSLGRSLFFSTARLLLGLGTGFLLCEIFHLEGVLRGVILIQFAMPSAVFNYLLAATYQRDAEEVAGVVVFSTLISFATLPLFLWYIL